LDDHGPGRRGGLCEGDIILRFDNQPVSSIDDLHRLLTEEKTGTTVPLTILRGTEKQSLSIVPEENKTQT
jgi:S1-C subfamily serine protease